MPHGPRSPAWQTPSNPPPRDIAVADGQPSRSVSILMAVVAGSASSTQLRLLENIDAVHQTREAHRAVVAWAVCAYDDRADAWSDTQRQAAGALLLVLNASSPQQPIGPQQRRAKFHHRARLVRAVWQQQPSGAKTFENIWLLDDDISFRGFNMAAFLSSWLCALGPAGPPMIAQPTLHNGSLSGQPFPQNDLTYELCLTGKLGDEYGDSACFLRSALALRSDWLEQWATLLDASFLSWFLNQTTTKLVLKNQLKYNSDFGVDEIWCGAAEEWAAAVTPTRARGRNATRRSSCVVIPLPLIHDDTRSQGHGHDRSYVLSGFRVLSYSGLRFPQSMVGRSCHGRNCTPHRWWRYTPRLKWALPDTLDRIERVRACVATQLFCPGDSSPPPSSSYGLININGTSDCAGLTDLHWDTYPGD